MCGRFALYEVEDIVENMFDVQIDFDLPPRTDIRPTDLVLAIVQDHAENMRWQLVPSWSDGKVSVSTFNARSEDAKTKPFFKDAFAKNQRCLIPANGFYEWKGEKGKKKRYFFDLKNEPLMVMAGLWDEWRGKENVIRSCTILTTDANEIVKPIHEKNRMPVILHRDQFSDWLNPKISSDQVFAWAKPFPSEEMRVKELEPETRDSGQMNLF